jgi:HD-GYP domain-containing protein (c-di-GMP phosphodiesterase class II)
MATGKVKIEVRALKDGMFVCELDRPWHETPFPLQGFYIRDEDDIKALQPFCRHVYVDSLRTKNQSVYTSNSVPGAEAKSKPVPKDTHSSNSAKIKHTEEKEKVVKLAPLIIKKPRRYQVSNTVKKEVSKAKKLHRNVCEAMQGVFKAVQNGGDISLKETSQLADGLVESVARNPDALIWLSKMSDYDLHAYQHVVRSSIWALVLGRHLGLDKPLLKTLAMGVLFCQVGKMKIAPALLDDVENLSGQALLDYQQYVSESVRILKTMEGIGEGVIAIAEFHRERHNGTGFPKGLTGDQIPLMAKIAGLVDYYQYLITPRENTCGCSPQEAVAQLYALRNIAFQQDLVEKLIEAVGVYPTGTLVELSNRHVGIVTGHHVDRRLQPKLILILDADKKPLRSAKVLDLKEWNEGKIDSDCLFINGSLPKGAFGVDENAYLLSGAKSKWSLKHLSASLSR